MAGRILLLGSLLLAACGTNTRQAPSLPLTSGDPPPAERVEIPGPPLEPGQVWVCGHWTKTEAGWEWDSGGYVTPPREGALWAPGRWVEGDGKWTWIVGGWR
ncbi:MAG TPA: hypothetical protein VFI25_00155 [Planctomycetota bacterium]|jgi:hypothetical protein|nr:hypothetical protein [Planctomycetota bacterium]